MRRAIGSIFLIVALSFIGVEPLGGQDGTVHVVQPGENLLRIAQYYSITAEALMRANAILEPDQIMVGQVLFVPGDAPPDDLGLIDVRPQTPTAPDTPPEDKAGSAAQEPVTTAGEERAPALPAPDTGEPAALAGPAPPEPRASAQRMLVHRAVARAVEQAARVDGSAPVPEPNLSRPAHAPGARYRDASVLEPQQVRVAESPSVALAAVSAPSDPSAVIPDLGIMVPSGPAWLLQPGLTTSGGPQVRAIYERGQALGNNPRAFSKIGDCNSEPPFFLSRFEGRGYDLGSYASLQVVVDHFAGSFARPSMAAWTGNHAWAVFEPLWANPAFCLAGETPIACEFRVHRPTIALIALGTNEVGSTALFETSLRRIVEYSIEQGVIPVLGTKADQLEGSDAHNEIIRALAGEYGVPLWDFGRAAESLPGRGLQPDGFHLTYVEPYYNQPAALQSGHAVHNLTALMALDTVWHAVMNETPQG